MIFEFDAENSNINFIKHGINFVDAQSLWEDTDYMEIPLKTMGEARFMVIGSIGSKVWSAIITYRGERVRIISVRRARREEVAIYES